MRLFSIFFLFVATVNGLHAQGGCIYGQVVDTNGNSIQDLTIHAGQSDQSYGLEVDTDADGRFFLTDLPLGGYEIFASDESKVQTEQLSRNTSYPASATHVEVTADGPCPQITLHSAPRARLLLNVTDALSGEKIDSVGGSFRIGKDSSWKGNAADGEMLVPPLTNLELQFGARGHENSAIQQLSELQPAETREISVALRPVQPGCVVGVVLDRQGAPASGIRVKLSQHADHLRFDPAIKLTGKNGEFEFDSLQPGDYFVFTDGQNYVPGLSQAPQENSMVTVAAGAGCSNITVSLGHKGARLELVILDAITHAPVHDAEFLLTGFLNDGRNGSWSIKANGRSVTVPSLQMFQLSTSAKGYQTTKIERSPMQPEEIQKITIELQPEKKSQAAN